MKELYDLLSEYNDMDYYPFHMPGHKRRACFHDNNILAQAHQIDITEIEGFDNLHHAESILKDAQARVAKLYGAEESFFLVNGSTGGLLSAISAVCESGKKVLIARNCHNAVYNAVCINKVKAEYVWPSYISEYDLTGPILPEDIRALLEKACYTDEKKAEEQKICEISAVVITSPTYDGVVSDVKQIAEIVHQYNIPLIVDEAHGAHFAFDDRFPKSAVCAGADIVINSTHKTLPAMTQTALLHVQGELIDRERLKKYLQMYQTSSPSYVLMASIDSCMELIEREGKAFFEPLFLFRELIDEKAEKLQKLRIVPTQIIEPGKIIISTKGTRITGQELYNILLQQYHIQLEMAGYNYVVAILTAMDTQEGVLRLMEALETIDSGIEKFQNAESSEVQKTKYIEESIVCKERHQDYASYEVICLEKEWIDLTEALGRTAGEALMLYPPGIPFLVPGEVISKEVLSEISIALERNMNLLGLSSDKKCIRCIITSRCKL